MSARNANNPAKTKTVSEPPTAPASEKCPPFWRTESASLRELEIKRMGPVRETIAAKKPRIPPKPLNAICLISANSIRDTLPSLTNVFRNLLGEHPRSGNTEMRVCVSIQREINASVWGKTLVIPGQSIDEQLSVVVAAIARVKQEISVSRKEYAPECIRAIIRALESLPPRQR